MSCGVTGTTLRGMTHVPPPAEELRLLDAELWQLDNRRAQLLARRAWLVAALQAVPQPPRAPAPHAVPARPETDAPRVQNVLLLLGGVLLTVAAMVFTLVSWGHLGIAGRAAVLGVLTLGVLAAPVPLLRRGLRSTAESVAGLGLALTALDAYALHETVFAGTDGTACAAASTATLAVLWAAYGLLPRTSTLRLPVPAAVAAAQLPLLLWALAAETGPYGCAAALLVTAGLDTVVALRPTPSTPTPVRVTAAVGAYGMGGWGILTAGLLSWTAAGPSAAARAAALLLLAAGITVGASWRLATQGATGGVTDADGADVDGATTGDTTRAGAGESEAGSNTAAVGAAWRGGAGGRAPSGRVAGPGEDGVAVGHAAFGALLLVLAGGGLPRAVLPGDWTVPGYLACGVALLAALRGPLPTAVRRGFVRASGVAQAVAAVCALPLVVVALLGPLGWAREAWSGVPSDARAAVTVHTPWPAFPTQVLLAPVVVAVVLALLVRDATWRPRALTGATVLAWATVMTIPSAFQLPYLVALLVPGLLTAAALWAAASRPHPWIALAVGTSVPLVFLALSSQPATLAVLSALTALFAAASLRPRLTPVTAPTALVHATALACAIGAAAGWAPQHTALLVLAVPTAAALLAARLGDPRATVPVEASGIAAAVLAIGLAVPDRPMLALVLALCGVLAAGTAVRPDRRPVGYAAAALFVLAAWVRLAAWGVGTVEAYTLPVTVPALVVGAMRRRRDPQASSWTAYGPGLASTLLPSLVAAWADPHWVRPLLLAAAALLTTLLGARHRLQAPLVLGGSVLVLDALHELAPYLVQLTGALPRWVPFALAGLLLLTLGATYERRLSQARQLRDFLGGMH
ncbi:SCO7613 C-terminal domain-containing membrane protein [Streptomyces sp. NPDC058954]|uniref:SCO7613 C-terminal domain-containing membrane protein n=1 Tax=Streptomyces sp. NPDC058954 TaxID=3346677 RepID=UPI0036CF24EB